MRSRKAQDYEELIHDIKLDAGNYCTPQVMRLSMKDRKAGLQQALSDWDKILVKASKALSTKKSFRLRQCLRALIEVMVCLDIEMSDAEVQHAKRREYETALAEARDGLDELERDGERHVQYVACERRAMLQSRQLEHLRALLVARLPHFGERVPGLQLIRVREEIAERLQVMIANDMPAPDYSAASSVLAERIVGHLAVLRSVSWRAETLHKAASVGAEALQAAAGIGFNIVGLPVVATPVLVVGGVTIAAAAVVRAVEEWNARIINEEFVEQEVDALYGDILSRVEEYTRADYQLMLSRALAEVERQESLLASLNATDLQDLVRTGFTSTYADLRAEYRALSEQCQVALDHGAAVS